MASSSPPRTSAASARDRCICRSATAGCGPAATRSRALRHADPDCGRLGDDARNDQASSGSPRFLSTRSSRPATAPGARHPPRPPTCAAADRHQHAGHGRRRAPAHARRNDPVGPDPRDHFDRRSAADARRPGLTCAAISKTVPPEVLRDVFRTLPNLIGPETGTPFARAPGRRRAQLRVRRALRRGVAFDALAPRCPPGSCRASRFAEGSRPEDLVQPARQCRGAALPRLTGRDRSTRRRRGRTSTIWSASSRTWCAPG